MDRLREKSRTLQQEFDSFEYNGEQVFCTSAQNAMVSKDIVNELAPLLPADDQETTKKLRRLQAMLEAATLTDINHRARRSPTPREPFISSSGSSGNHRG